MAKNILPFLLALSLAGIATADEVRLHSGLAVEGIARREPGRVVVETRLGTLTFPADQVKEIVPGKSALHEYQDRLAALGEKPSGAQIFDLAMWARDRGLVRYVNPLLQRTIDLEPNHREARGLLGYVRDGGSWMTRGEWETRVAPRPASTAQRRETAIRTRPIHPQPEVSPGYVYFGIPPSIPPRGSQNHGAGGYSNAYPLYTRGMILY